MPTHLSHKLRECAAPNNSGRDHEGSDTALFQLSDDLEDNHWRTGKGSGDAKIN